MIFVVTISLIIHCSYYIFIFSKLSFYQEKNHVTNKPKNESSIVICYHNEEQNVDKYLPSILKQNIDDMVLVDDNSIDDTLKRLNHHKKDKAKILSIKNNSAGKKHALSQGIQASKNDKILLTDADCKPASENWALYMCKKATPFVLGYGPMNKISGIIALFSRFETYMTALQYLSYALAGIPYMGVGRNMMIDKSMVLRQRNNLKGSHLASGDDDLMINALANNQNTSICIHPESFMYSDPKTTLKGFLVQKTRHISTSIYYKSIHKVLLSFFSGSQLLFFLGLIFGLLIGTIQLKIALMLLLTKWVIQQAINYSVMKKLKEDDLFWKFPVLDILFFMYLMTMPIYYLFNKNNSRWS